VGWSLHSNPATAAIATAMPALNSVRRDLAGRRDSRATN
jgi:hypothetical protein